MAKFDPDVQVEGQREYTNEYRPISQPMSDQSGLIRGVGKGLLYGEVGKLAGEELKVTDEVQKEAIDADIRQARQPIVDEHLTQLAQLSKQLGGPDVMDQLDSTHVPDEIKALPNRVDNLVAMKANGKGVDDTYYQMQMLNLATRMRAKYPGWEDHVDTAMWKATKLDPANQVVSNLESRIKEIQTAARAQQDKVLNHVYSMAQEGMISPNVMAQMEAGQLDPDPRVNVMKAYLAGVERAYTRHFVTDTRAAMEMDELGKKTDYEKNEGAMQVAMAKVLTDRVKEFRLTNQLGDKESLVKLLGEMELHPEKFKDTDKLTQVERIIDNLKTDLNTQLRADWLSHADKLGPGGSEKIEKAINVQLGMLDSLKSIPHGLSLVSAQYLANKGVDMQADFERKNQVATLIRVLNPIAAQNPAFKAMYDSLMQIKNAEGKDIGESINGHTEALLQAHTGTKLDPNSWDGENYTMTDILRDGTRHKWDPYHIRKAIRDIGDTAISPVPPDIRDNAVKTLYGDPNALVPVAPDSVDAYGRNHPGKNSTFEEVVSPAHTQAAKLSGGQNWENYKKFAVNSYGSILLSEIKTLNNLPSYFTGPIRTGPVQNLDQVEKTPDQPKFALNESNRWVLAPGERDRLNSLSPGFGNRLQQSFDRINRGTKAMESVWNEADIKDPRSFFLNMLVQSGLNPRVLVNSIPGRMLQALHAAEPPPKPKAEPANE